jgi:hypothetical protein
MVQANTTVQRAADQTIEPFHHTQYQKKDGWIIHVFPALGFIPFVESFGLLLQTNLWTFPR